MPSSSNIKHDFNKYPEKIPPDKNGSPAAPANGRTGHESIDASQAATRPSPETPRADPPCETPAANANADAESPMAPNDERVVGGDATPQTGPAGPDDVTDTISQAGDDGGATVDEGTDQDDQGPPAPEDDDKAAETATDNSDADPEVDVDVAGRIISVIESSPAHADALKKLRAAYRRRFDNLSLDERAWSMIVIVLMGVEDIVGDDFVHLMAGAIDGLMDAKTGQDGAVAELGAIVRTAAPVQYDALIEKLRGTHNPLGLGHYPSISRIAMLDSTTPGHRRILANRADERLARIEILARPARGDRFPARTALDLDTIDELALLEVELRRLGEEMYALDLGKPVYPDRTDPKKIMTESAQVQKSILERRRLLAAPPQTKRRSTRRPIWRLRSIDLGNVGAFELAPGEQTSIEWLTNDDDGGGETLLQVLIRRPHSAPESDTASGPRGGRAVNLELRYRARCERNITREVMAILTASVETTVSQAKLNCGSCDVHADELFLVPESVDFVCRHCRSHDRPQQ